MLIVRCAQGSEEWRSARSGVITASMFSVIRKKVGGLDEKQSAYVTARVEGKSEAEAMLIAGYKAKPRAEAVERALAGLPVGDWSDAAKDYAFRLAVERISGEPLDEGHETWAMRRGYELEPEARHAHECKAGVVVQPCGLVLTDDGAFGASADGFIGGDTGAEYKALVDPARLRTVLIDHDLSQFEDQMFGGMWITGRKRWHFALYCPALKPIGQELWWHVLERDDDYIEKMEADLIAFKALVDANEAALRSMPQAKAA